MSEGLDLDTFTDPIEFALGMHKHDNLTTIAIHAEIVSRLLYKTPELSPERLLEAVKSKLNQIDRKRKGKY